LYEKVTQGSLASTAIDQAVFSLDVGKLSQIIEDDTGYHIIRVKERTQAGYISFQDAQPDIRTALKLQKQNDERQKIFAELAAKTKVWTIYDPPADVQRSAKAAGAISFRCLTFPSRAGDTSRPEAVNGSPLCWRVQWGRFAAGW
jgi:hypothetical protein